jgi:hypothetical protein
MNEGKKSGGTFASDSLMGIAWNIIFFLQAVLLAGPTSVRFGGSFLLDHWKKKQGDACKDHFLAVLDKCCVTKFRHAHHTEVINVHY